MEAPGGDHKYTHSPSPPGSRGGDVVIREVRGKDARVALLGNCKGCPAAQITIEQTVQRILVEKMGDQIGKVILVNEIDPSILDFARQFLNPQK